MTKRKPGEKRAKIKIKGRKNTRKKKPVRAFSNVVACAGPCVGPLEYTLPVFTSVYRSNYGHVALREHQHCKAANCKTNCTNVALLE